MSRTDGGDPGLGLAELLAQLGGGGGAPGSGDGGPSRVREAERAEGDDDRAPADAGEVADGAGGAGGAGSAGDGEGEGAVDAALEALLSRPEVAERLSRRTELHTRQLRRLFEQAVVGDEAALSRLLEDRHGRALWEVHQRRVEAEAAERARVEAERLVAWRQLLELRESNPTAYAAYMRSREWRQFANEMEEQWGDDLAALGGRVTSGGDAHAQAHAQSQAQAASRTGRAAGAGAGAGVSLWRLSERLLSSDAARVLTDRDREELDPDAFADLPPDEAAARMAERFAQLVARRSGGAGAARGRSGGASGGGADAAAARAELSALLRAAGAAPPALPTGTAVDLMTDDDERMLDLYNANPGDPRAAQWFAANRDRLYRSLRRGP